MQQRERIYLAGPMTGSPANNVPLFEAEAARIRAMGHEVVSPVEISAEFLLDPNQKPTPALRKHLLAVDIREIVKRDCDAIYLLDGWERNSGSFGEWAFARAIGLRVYGQTPGRIEFSGDRVYHHAINGVEYDSVASIDLDILALEPAEVRQ